MRSILRNLVARTLLLAPARLSGVSILAYHSIAPTTTGFITDAPEAFEHQLSYIKSRGFRTVFASELPDLLSRSDTENTICVTLDDGYRDNLTTALPLLKKYGVRATVFLPTGLIGKELADSSGTSRPIVTEEQIREMLASGLVEFLPHGSSHTELPSLSDAALDKEIADSAETIARLTGKQPRVFAYPRGAVDNRVIAALRRHEFTAAVGTEPGIARADSDPFRLPRNSLGKISDAELAVKLSDRLDAYVALKRLA